MSLPVRPDASTDRPVPPDAPSLGWPIGGGLALALTLTLLVGLQLGAMPWKFRRQMWQLQGALAGGVAGLVVGYVVGRGRPRP
jgi:FtsH-binding integral membrane protein